MEKRLLFLVYSLLLCFVALAATVKVSVEMSAESEILPIESDTPTDEFASQSQVVNINSGNYSFSQSPPEFMIKNTIGSIVIENNIISLAFDSFFVVIPQFNFYKIIGVSGNTRFFQADTLLEQNAENPFAFIAVYLPSNAYSYEAYTMVVQYGVAVESVLYNIKISVQNNEVGFLESISEELVLGDDDVSSRLKDSVRIISMGEEIKNIDEGFPQGALPVKALSNITPKSYDSYTDSDGILHSYHNFGYPTKVNGLITDDPIVRIIPKELCFIQGEHLYVGKQYGFFIKTVTTSSNRYADIMVFDIYHSPPSFPSNTTGITKVTPLFQI